MSRPEFDRKVAEIIDSSAGKNHQFITNQERTEIVDFLSTYSQGSEQPREGKHYRWIRTLTLTNYAGHLELTRKDGGKRVVPVEELFNVIQNCHLTLGHAGRDKVIFELRKTYHISKKLVDLYLSTCLICDEKRNRPRKNVVVKSIISEEMNSRAQVDLICFDSSKRIEDTAKF